MTPELLESFLFEIVIFTTAPQKILFANSSARRNLGFSLKEITQLPLASLYREEVSPPASRQLGTLLDKCTRQPVTLEVSYRRKNGSCYPVKCYFEHTVYEKMDCIMATSLDISNPITFTDIVRHFRNSRTTDGMHNLHTEEIQQYREDMAHVSRMMTLNEIVSGIAHEVSQPLASISTYAQTCLQIMSNQEGGGTVSTTELKQALQQIHDQSHRAGAVISQLRSRVQKREIDPVRIGLNSLITYTLTLLEADIRRQNIALRVDLQPTLPEVEGVPIQLQQILFNLVTNAMDAINSRAGKEKTISISSEQVATDEVRITVSDTGTGIAKEDKDKIFSAYFSTKSTGMGIGLSICQSIIRAHGGRLDFNRRKRRGAEFFFTLPPVIKNTAIKTEAVYNGNT